MKTSVLLFFLILICRPVAAEPLDASTPRDPFYLEVGVVNDFPIQSSLGYGYGAGGQVALGYSLDPNMSIQLNVNDLYFPNEAIGIADNEIRIYPELKLYFSTLNDIRPYVFAGTGLDLEMIGTSPATNWIAEAGLGIEWSIKSDLGLFVEAKGNWLRTNLDTATIDQDIPLVWGLRFGL